MSIKTVIKQYNKYNIYNFLNLGLNKINNNEINNRIPSKENDYINKSEIKNNKIEPKTNLIFSENDIQISGFENNGNNTTGKNNTNNLTQNHRNFTNSEKINNNKMNRINNSEDLYITYNNNMLNQSEFDKNDNFKYNFLTDQINRNSNFNNSSVDNNNFESSYLSKINNEQKNKNITQYNELNENILLKGKISSLEQKISQYEKQNKEFYIYINLIYDFINNINQISMNQLNIDTSQFSNKLIDINIFKNILNKTQNYVKYLQKELNNINSNNYYSNEKESNYNNKYNMNYRNYYNNEQFEIYKTLEDRINLLEKELYMQKQNFMANNGDINKVNGTEKIKSKKNSKKKFKPLNNIYELPKEGPKSTSMRNKQRLNKLNKKTEKINNTNYNNQIHQMRNNKIFNISNRKCNYKIKDNENKKRSITPLNSRLKKYFK